MDIRNLLYIVARMMGDYRAIKKGKAAQRIGRRILGKITGRLFK
jgi:hypothetical protein